MLLRHDTLYGRPNGRIVTPPAKITRAPIALDRAKPSLKSIFVRAKKIETNYAARLRKIARHIGDIVKEFPQGTLEAAVLIRAALEKYALALDPWAKAVAERMVAEVAQRDERSWKQASAQIGRALEAEIATAPTGQILREAMARQVHYITSLPIDAAERVHHETIKGISEGKRASEIAKTIMETGLVSRSRADLVAVTEVARTAANLTEARARYVGSTHYRWHSAGDSDVRPDHKALNNKIFAWNDPPIADRRTGAKAHPGCIYRCRCYAEPLL